MVAAEFRCCAARVPGRVRVGASRVWLVALVVGGLAACGHDDVQFVADTAPRTTAFPEFGAALGVQDATYEYTIPDGAGDALAAGESLTVLPGSLTASVGQSIKIVNEDRRGHSVGPWFVGPDETLIQQFTAPGVYEGMCTVHPSGAFILTVVAG